ncbi:MAG TPA: DUF4381 domain-containing protein [Rhodanobacteraceae bacterium]
MRMPAGPVLRGIHMPPPASWWPLAPGWWVLAALLLIVMAWLAWRTWRRRLPRRRWREAERELDALIAKHQGDSTAFAAGVSQLQRRAARTLDPSTVGLGGEAWHLAMERLAGGHVSAQAFAGLEQAMYQPQATLDTTVVAEAMRRWLRHALLHGGRHA